MSPDRPEDTGTARFGFRLSGVPLLVPAGTTALFLPAAAIDPMPLAPRRLRGFTQRHGRPIPVFDAAAQAPERLPVRTRRPLLVFDGLAEPAALLVDVPPERIDGTLAPAAGARAPEVGWRDALADADRDARGGTWWRVDLTRLFDLLVQA